MQRILRAFGRTLFAAMLVVFGGKGVYAQSPAQSQTPAQVRSRAEETLEWWNQIGNKLIAMAKDFPEDKYDFKLQKEQRTFAQNLLHVAAIDYYLIGKVSGTKAGPDFGKDFENPSRDVYKTKANVAKLLEQAVAGWSGFDQAAGRRGDGQNDAVWVGNR